MSNLVLKSWKIAALAAFCASSYVALSQAYTINVTNAGIYKSANDMPYWADGPMATIKKSSSELYIWHSSGLGNPPQFHYSGPPDNPLKTQLWTKSHTQLVDYNGADSRTLFWITNIFAINNSNWEFLAFTHTELYDNPNSDSIPRFKIHVLYSRDGGNTWKNCGEIIRPKNYSYDKNIGGTSYLKVGEYFYVYINEHTDNGGRYIGVARAKAGDVISAARNSTVVTWNKFNNGAWDQDGKTGVCSEILSGNYDSHMDAAYNRAMKKYMIAVQNYTYNSLDLMTSTDGIDWDFETTLGWSDNPSTYTVYPTFVSTTNTTRDLREIGSFFRVFYAMHTFQGNAPLYQVSVTIN